MSDIIINMPAGGIQQIDGDELFWFRKAFDSEWKGAVMLRLSDDRIYSTESVEDLGRKFSEADVPVAGMTPVIPENYIRTDSRGSAESAHDPTRCAWS